ncbi:MAG: hypothetical protein KGO50_18565, partial [Myxococcales bacterium]|nr:hypothetical protein [Myxococcales bacterium]
MQTVTFEDITRDLSSLAMVDILENLATVCESSVIDLGWRIDEELLYVSSFYREDSVFGSPVASQLSRDALAGSMATALRFLMSRGEASIADSGDVILRGSMNFIAEFLTKVTRQATIEANSDGLRRCLALRRAGDLCLIDEVLPDGRHHLLLVSPQAEATFAA